MDCRIWPTGLVALTTHLRLVAVTSFDEPRPRFLADPGNKNVGLLIDRVGLKETPSSWTVIPPELSLSTNVEVLVAINSTILIVDASGCHDQVSIGVVCTDKLI